MNAKLGELVWFDIPVKNFETAKGFYGELLGWKFAPMGDAKNTAYWMIQVGAELVGERVYIPGNMGSFHLFRDQDKNLLGLWAQS